MFDDLIDYLNWRIILHVELEIAIALWNNIVAEHWREDEQGKQHVDQVRKGNPHLWEY